MKVPRGSKIPDDPSRYWPLIILQDDDENDRDLCQWAGTSPNNEPFWHPRDKMLPIRKRVSASPPVPTSAAMLEQDIVTFQWNVGRELAKAVKFCTPKRMTAVSPMVYVKLFMPYSEIFTEGIGKSCYRDPRVGGLFHIDKKKLGELIVRPGNIRFLCHDSILSSFATLMRLLCLFIFRLVGENC